MRAADVVAVLPGEQQLNVVLCPLRLPAGDGPNQSVPVVLVVGDLENLTPTQGGRCYAETGGEFDSLVKVDAFPRRSRRCCGSHTFSSNTASTTCR